MTGPTEPRTDNECELTLPAVDGVPRRSSARGATVVLAVMFGWLLIIYSMSAIVARNDPNVEIPTEVDAGVVVTPADGWYSAGDVWDVGEGGLALQKSGVYVAFWVSEFPGSNDELMAAVLAELRPAFDAFRVGPARPITLAGDLTGLLVYFSGNTEGGQEENELVVLSHGGLGVVMLAEALAGQLQWAQGDIDQMLSTLEVPR